MRPARFEIVRRAQVDEGASRADELLGRLANMPLDPRTGTKKDSYLVGEPDYPTEMIMTPHAGIKSRYDASFGPYGNLSVLVWNAA